MAALSLRTLAGLSVLAAVLSASPAWAQKADGKKRVIRMDEITVEGRIQKPQAFYILPRSSLNYEGLDRKETFLPKITRTFEQDPF
jgi:hypothetical protein